jgi:DNA-binding MarR family transcriptional regulator
LTPVHAAHTGGRDVGGERYASPVGGLDEPLAVIDASRRLAVVLGRRLDASLVELGITYAQLELLERIAQDRDAHPAELARSLGCSRQAVAALLSRLMRSDLIEIGALDHGVRVPAITDPGRRRARHASAALRRTLLRIEAVPAEERGSFVLAATSIRSAIRRDDAVW